MRFLLALVFTALLGFLAGLVFPWWIIAVVAFLVAIFIRQSPARSFLSGFAGIFLLWCFLAGWYDVNNHSLFSRKIALILPLGGSSSFLILLTACTGALVAGFAAMTAGAARDC